METIKSIIDYSFNIIKLFDNFLYIQSSSNLKIDDKKKLENKFKNLCNIIIKKLNEINNEYNKFIEYEKNILDENNKYDSYLIHIPKSKNNKKYIEFLKIRNKILNEHKFKLNKDSILFAKENYEDVIRYNIICFTEDINNKINIHICKILNNNEYIELQRIDYINNLSSRYFLDKCEIKNYSIIPKPFNISNFK